MKKIIQFAAQYLIAAEASFLDPKGTKRIALNLSLKEHCLHTKRLTTAGDMLVFNHDFFTLEWRSDIGLKDKIVFQNSPHFEIVRWIETMAVESGIKNTFRFDKFGYYPATNGTALINSILDIPESRIDISA